jgi:hypothetical protein
MVATVTPQDPPKVLGVEMVPHGASWRLQFSQLDVALLTGYGEGGRGWCATVGDIYVAPSGRDTRGECIAAIERELLAIRAAIPEQKGGEK